MKSRVLCFVILFFFSGALFAAPRKAHLQFLPNTPVVLKSDISLEVSQSLPGLSLSTKGNQALKAQLTVKGLGGASDMPIAQPPLLLTFTLKNLKISLRANDAELRFDSDELESSLYISQVSKLIDRPVELRFGKDFRLEEGGQELQQMTKELPVLQEINPQALLIDLFLHLFALGGVELTEGAVITRQFPGLDIPALPTKADYTVTSIDDYNIHASFKGNIEKQTFSLSGKVQVDENKEEVVKVTLGGTMEGKGKWNRDNAMLYDLEARYAYSAMFKLGEWEWMMHINAAVHNATQNP